jgi:hypothetical protein
MENDPGGTPVQTGGGSQVAQTTEQAKQQSQQLAQHARRQTSELANRGTEQVKSRLANQKHEAAQRMRPIQTALQETAHQLRNQGQGSVAQYADRAADQVEQFSGYLRENDVDQLLDEVRNVARSRPALFLGGAAALGFFATRFLKSSSEEASSAGEGSSASPTATSEAAVTYGPEEPATALPPDSVEEPPTAARSTPLAGQPLNERDRTETGGEPTGPPRAS